MRSSADIVSPMSYPYPKSVSVTEVTAPPETTIVAFAFFPSPLVDIGTFASVSYTHLRAHET